MHELLRRLQQLSDEINHYPTPIAHCDKQLTALLEQPTALLEQLRRVARPSAPRPPENTWINDGGFHAA